MKRQLLWDGGSSKIRSNWGKTCTERLIGGDFMEESLCFFLSWELRKETRKKEKTNTKKLIMRETIRGKYAVYV